MLHEKHPAVDM